MARKRGIFLLIVLLLILIVLNYSFIDKILENNFSAESGRESVFVSRIIDGDTIELEDKSDVRLLGINSPEKGEQYYDEAKNFLKEKAENKTVFLEYGKDKTDLYNRTLAYIFINGENINLDLVKNGYANYYFPSGKDKYYPLFENAWEECLNNKKNLCESSESVCAPCITLKEINIESQEAIFYNDCRINCTLKDWSVKDEGRKKYVFGNFMFRGRSEVILKVSDGKNNITNLFWESEEYVWTKTGDTLFLRDNKNKLVLWEKM